MVQLKLEDYLETKGFEALKNEEFESALDFFSALLSFEESVNSYVNLGKAFESVLDDEMAFNFYYAAHEREPENLIPLYHMAMLGYTFNEADLFLEFSKKYLKLKPDDLEMKIKSVEVNHYIGNNKTALEISNSLLDANLDDNQRYKVYSMLGSIYDSFLDVDNSKKYYLLALDLNSDAGPEIFSNLGLLFESLGDNLSAFEFYREGYIKHKDGLCKARMCDLRVLDEVVGDSEIYGNFDPEDSGFEPLFAHETLIVPKSLAYYKH